MGELMISVVMTCFNREKYLSQAIESVLAQTYENFELIIWDDGSIDSSVDIAYRCAKTDSRVKVVAAPHQGCNVALKQAIASSKGEYFGCVDSDDFIDSSCLEKTLVVLKSNKKLGYVYTQHYEVDEHGNTLNLGKHCNTPYMKGLMLLRFLTGHFRLIRRSVYDLIGGVSDRYPIAVDYELCLRLSEVAEVQQLREPLYFYRQHTDRISANKQAQQAKYAWQASSEAAQRRSPNKVKL